MELWDRPDVRPLLLGVVRSATTDPLAAGDAPADADRGPAAGDRPGASARPTPPPGPASPGRQLVGLVLARYVVGVEPIASMTPDEVAAAVGPDHRALPGGGRAARRGGRARVGLARMRTPAADAAALARDPAALAEALLARRAGARGAAPRDVRVVHAPGRVNLIGEHTDYNEGFVLPVAIDLGIAIALVPADDRRVELTLAATGETLGFDLDAIGARRGAWIDYVGGHRVGPGRGRRAAARASAGSSPRTCRRARGCRRRRRWSWRRRSRSPAARRRTSTG